MVIDIVIEGDSLNSNYTIKWLSFTIEWEWSKVFLYVSGSEIWVEDIDLAKTTEVWLDISIES